MKYVPVEKVDRIEISKPKIDVPEKKVEKVFANLKVGNLKSAGYISKSGDKQEETNNSHKPDLIKISFAIDANPNAKAEKKIQYPSRKWHQ